MPNLVRRALLGAAAGALVAACGRGNARSTRSAALPGQPAPPEQATATQAAPALPTPTPTPAPPPRGSEERLLLPGTPSEARLIIRHSGVRGPAAMVLGGVHGNEPGGWLAGDEVATWEPAAGSLFVVPRANVQALAALVRTTDELGDLNRLYPGNPDSRLLMERMAAAILDTAREFEVELLLDMHESWAFYIDYPGAGTGALGQTVTTGQGPLYPDFGKELIARVNPSMSTREQMLIRDGSPFGRPGPTPAPGQPNRGRSSLSAGGYVAGLTPVLVEMGQEHQPVARRVELHLIVARAALELLNVL